MLLQIFPEPSTNQVPSGIHPFMKFRGYSAHCSTTGYEEEGGGVGVWGLSGGWARGSLKQRLLLGLLNVK